MFERAVFHELIGIFGALIPVVAVIAIVVHGFRGEAACFASANGESAGGA
jgi:hypothetical protein